MSQQGRSDLTHDAPILSESNGSSAAGRAAIWRGHRRPAGNAAPGSREPSTLFKVGNAHFQLNLAAGQGMKVELVHTPSRIALAAGDYSYSFGQPSFAEASTADEDHATLLKLVGDIGNGLEIGSAVFGSPRPALGGGRDHPDEPESPPDRFAGRAVWIRTSRARWWATPLNPA